MLIRKTLPGDLDRIEEIYTAAKEYMRINGNPTQWNTDSPSRKTAEEDMKNGVGYVCEDSGEVVAVFMFAIGPDEIYDKIYDGAWLSDESYAVMHRVAVGKHGAGIIDFCFSECLKMFPNIRIDTHKDNIPMQKVLKRSGFEYCGKIYLKNGDERIAFQNILSKKV